MTQNEGKETQGRKFDQLTRDGSSSAGSTGARGTGDSGNLQRGEGAQDTYSDSPEGMETGGRTDDLLSGGVEEGRNAQGFAAGKEAAGAAKRQDEKQEGAGSARGGGQNPGNRQSE